MLVMSIIGNTFKGVENMFGCIVCVFLCFYFKRAIVGFLQF